MVPGLVTIGMPVYNGGLQVRSAIEQILAQTETNFELVISDNASTDTITKQITEEFAKKDSRVRLIRQPVNLGAVGNFLWLVEQAQGEFFMWAAHDDSWSPNYVELLAKQLKANPQAVLATGTTSVTRTLRSGERIPRTLPPAPNKDRWDTLDVFIRQAGCEWVYGVYRTDWLKTSTPEWRNFPTEYGDLIWIFGLMLQNQVVGDPQAVFSYHNAHQNKRSPNRRAELWSKLIYHLVRLSWVRLRPSERLHGLYCASRIVYRFHIYRRGFMGTPLNIIKLSALWASYGIERAFLGLFRPRSMAR